MGGPSTMIRRIASLLGIGLSLVVIAAGIGLSLPPTAPTRADEAVSQAPTSPTPVLQSPTSAPSAATSPSPALLGDGWHIRIARIGIDLPIKDGVPGRDIALQRTPDGAAYRLAGSALPGNAGNTYLYGHARWAQFIGLWYVHLDDLVVISGPGTTLYYRVTEIHPRVATDDITYLLPSDEERLTLQTSSGPDATDPRFVVVAVPGS
jgi:sortase (surface protein transpeptidase)